MLFFQACLDINTTSQVNSDGSILRTVTIVGDSAAIFRSDFPFPLDSLWQKRIDKVEEKKQDYQLTATRLFKNVGDLNHALRGALGKTLEFRFELEKSFQWFFTTYRYSETNLKFIQFDTIPITDFLSRSEIDFWIYHLGEKPIVLTKGDSLALMDAEPRREEWERRNKFEAIFAAFLDGARLLNSPSLKPSFVEASKDTLYRISQKSLEKDNVDTLRFVFARFLKSASVHDAWRTNEKVFTEIKRKLDLGFGSHTYVTSVMMPGLITNSNTRIIEGNKATWRDYKDIAKCFGYTMWVESREVNWWAVILTGSIALGILVLLVASTLRRRNRF